MLLIPKDTALIVSLSGADVKFFRACHRDDGWRPFTCPC